MAAIDTNRIARPLSINPHMMNPLGRVYGAVVGWYEARATRCPS